MLSVLREVHTAGMQGEEKPGMRNVDEVIQSCERPWGTFILEAMRKLFGASSKKWPSQNCVFKRSLSLEEWAQEDELNSV